ncbi:S8 family peptidase [Sphingomonas sp.]|uniref:S8 family peptidase n=1 Tax=Sphingomonas sp. TaxID=28214 RepID=UPI0035BC1734
MPPPASTVPAGAAPTLPVSSPGYAAGAAAPAGSILTPAAMQPVRSANDTAEFRQNYVANELVNALYALDHGWTGQGVTVGVLDDGVNTALPAFKDQISSLSKDFGYETQNGVTTKRDRLSDTQSDHGTAIAAIIAARRDGDTTVGIAPDAKIAILRTSDYNYTTGAEALAHDGEALDYAADAGIKVVNRSLASQGFNVSLRNAAAHYATTGGLLVNAAGNSGGDNPVDAVNVDATNRDAWLFVVALDPQVQSSYALAAYSNKAGSMADRSITAVGTSITTRVDGSITGFSGTSAAAAQVSGVAATILSKWPQLTGVQAGQVILATARDIGAPGVDATFGAGLIDVQAALSPVNPVLSNGSVQTAVASAVLAAPAAIGTGSIQTAVRNVTVLDQYGRDFSGSLANLVVTPEGGRAAWLRTRLAQMVNGGSSAFGAGPVSATVGYASYRTGTARGDVHQVMTSGELHYRAGRTGIGAGFNAQDSLQHDIMGLAPFADGILAYVPQAGNSLSLDRATPAGRIGISLASGSFGASRGQAATMSFDRGATSIRASWIDETGSVMGVVSSGALSLGRGARTAMIELHHSMGLAAGWTLEGYGSIGATRLKIDPASILTGASTLWGTRAGLQASGPLLRGVLSFGIAQPLTIESGRAKLTFGTGYDLASRSLLVSSTAADLASSTRRLQLTTGFSRGTARSNFRMGVMRDMSDGTTRGLAGYSHAF